MNKANYGPLDDIDIGHPKHPDEWGERSYRRGVQQGLGMLDHFLEHKRCRHVDGIYALDYAKDIAQDMRFDGEVHRCYMHELLKKLEGYLDLEKQ